MKVFHVFEFFSKGLITWSIAFAWNNGICQSFYFGADLSYVNEMEDCGADYKVNGSPIDPYRIFKDNGANLVRLRLWHTPSWYDGLNGGIRYSDLQDVRHSIMRAKSEGMDVLLDFHLSDTWADPGHQVAPATWTSVLDSLEILQDSLYNYIYNTLAALAEENLLPEIVQIGNETNKGILQSQAMNDAGWSLNWARNSALFNSAITAIRDIETAFDTEIKIALHIANPNDTNWLMEGFWDNGVRDFDIIGVSYYWQFHNVLIEIAGNTITDLKETYPGKEVMILETAYPWTSGSADGANNILSAVYPGYSPHTQAHQKDWMIALAQEVIDQGGKGIVYWEPAWVSTGCRTQFGLGSHWENATFFDFNENLIQEGGIGWMTHPYDFTLATTEINQIPNPIKIYQTRNEIVLERNDASLLNAPFEIELLTMEGKKVSTVRVDRNWSKNVIRINIPCIIPGIYFISLFSKDKLIAVKQIFVLQNW